MRVRLLAVTMATWCVLGVRAEPPISSYLPSAYSTMSQHSFAPPSAPTFSFSAPSAFSYSAPAKLYGVPKKTQIYSPPSPKYGVPSSSYGLPSHEEDYHSEPAHYEYHYNVHDHHHGTEFGHKESRKGDVAKGSYMVLLPDGRRQIVDYIADSHGYRPTIRYEGGHLDKFGYR